MTYARMQASPLGHMLEVLLLLLLLIKRQIIQDPGIQAPDNQARSHTGIPSGEAVAEHTRL